jgi:hypothetical protein
MAEEIQMKFETNSLLFRDFQSRDSLTSSALSRDMDAPFCEEDEFFDWFCDDGEPLSDLGQAHPVHADPTLVMAHPPPTQPLPPLRPAAAEPDRQPEPNELALVQDAPVSRPALDVP